MNKPVFPVIIGSLGLKSVSASVAALYECAGLLDRKVLMVQGTGALGIALNTTSVVRQMAKALGQDTWRGVFMQDDIYIPMSTVRDLANAITIADKNDLDFCVPCKQPNGIWNVENGMRDPEYKQLDSWARVSKSSLQFYYGHLFRDYEYHEGEHMTGEDWNFYQDNHIDLHVVKLPFKHVKEMLLG